MVILKNKIIFFCLFFCCIFISCSTFQKSEKCEIWTDRINTLKLCDDNRFYLDYGYHGYYKFNSYRNKPFYTGSYVKMFNRIVLLFDLPYFITIEHDTLLKGTEIFVESLVDSCNSKCHAFLKVAKKGDVEMLETDLNGYCKINGYFDSLYISIRLSSCNSRFAKETIDEALSSGDMFWYPIKSGFSMYNKRVILKYTEDVDNINPVKYKVILKRKRFKGYIVEDNFFVLYTVNKSKKIVIIEKNGELNYYKEDNLINDIK